MSDSGRGPGARGSSRSLKGIGGSRLEDTLVKGRNGRASAEHSDVNGADDLARRRFGPGRGDIWPTSTAVVAGTATSWLLSSIGSYHGTFITLLAPQGLLKVLRSATF